MTNKIKNYFENLKNDSKLRKQSIAIGSACLAVIVCAVAIPVGVHNHNVKKVAMAEAENSAVETVSETMAELTTADETTAVPEGYETTIVEADGTTKIELIEKTEPTSAVQTATNAPAASNGVTTTKKASSVKDNSGSASSTTKTATTKAPATTSASTETPVKKITRADLEALIPGWKTYGESLGMIWDNSFNYDNSCWSSGIPIVYNDDINYIDKKVRSSIYYYSNNAQAKYFKVVISDENNSFCDWSATVLWMQN